MGGNMGSTRVQRVRPRSTHLHTGTSWVLRCQMLHLHEKSVEHEAYHVSSES